MRPTGVNPLIVACGWARYRRSPASGDLVTQRLGDIQVSVVHDARRPEEEIAALHQLGLGPIEILECRVGARDELRHDNGLRPRVKRSPVQQEAECGKVRRAMLLGLHPLQRLGDECLDQVRLCLLGQAFERAGEADKFRRRFPARIVASSPASSLSWRSAARPPATRRQRMYS